MIFSNVEKLFLEKRVEFFNEYDRGNFISNSKYALRENVSQFYISLKSDYAALLLQNAEKYLAKISVDNYAVTEFINKILGSEEINTAGLSMIDVTKLDNTVIKTNYLRESIEFTSREAIKVIQGVYGTDKVKKLYAEMDSYTLSLKKRIAKSDVDYNMKEVELIRFRPQPSVPVTNDYLESVVIPFIQNMPKTKTALTNELAVVRQSVNYTVSRCTELVENLHNTLINETLSPKVEILLSKFIYARVRAIMDAVSYTSFIMIRKIHYYEEAITSVQDVYNRLTLLFNSKKPLLEYGVFDKRVISPTDTKSIVEKMVEGRTDIYDELANNIMEFHKGHIGIMAGLSDAEVSTGELTNYFDILSDHFEYDHRPYQGIVNAYSEVDRGLDNLAKNSDDYLMIFDELIKKSGFVVALPERFKNDIDALEDLTYYNLADINIGDNKSTKDDLYFRILCEISQFPNNVKTIAKTIHQVSVKLEYVHDLFHNDKNGELEYSETMNELKIFIDDLREQFDKMNEKVCGNLFKRLKMMSAKADLCIDGSDEAIIDNPLASPEFSRDDFFKEAVIESIEYDNLVNDVMMEVLMKEYYSYKEYKERGVTLVFEADAVAPTANTPTTNQNANKPSTKPTVTDNNEVVTQNKKSSSGKINQAKLNEILKSISTWFEKMMESFNNMIDRIKVKNLNWLKNNKDGLTNRSYANVQINILPYDNMGTETILGDISKMSTNVRSMNATRVRSITTAEGMRDALINFGPKFNNKNVDDTTAITNYYKVGNKPTEVVTYSNNEVKTLVINTMLPYCEQFYDNFKNTVTTRLGEVKKSMESVIKTYVTEAMDLYATGNIYMEDGETVTTNKTGSTTPTATTTSSDNKNISIGMTDSSKWLRDSVRMFSGSILNAIRDRNNDYLKVLFALAPKNNNTQQQNKQEQQPQEGNQVQPEGQQ